VQVIPMGTPIYAWAYWYRVETSIVVNSRIEIRRFGAPFLSSYSIVSSRFLTSASGDVDPVQYG
jgi:hypothetical protein